MRSKYWIVTAVVSVLSTLLLPRTVQAQTIVIQKSGGGKNGYDKVDEQHTGSGRTARSTLTCSGVGYTKAEWSMEPKTDGKPIPGFPSLVEEAEKEIHRGAKKGRIAREYGDKVVIVRYTAKKRRDYTITLEVWDLVLQPAETPTPSQAVPGLAPRK